MIPSFRALKVLLTISCIVAALGSASPAFAASIRLLTHDSFSLPTGMLEEFEKKHNITVEVIQAGDAGAMVNTMVLTAAQPIADIVYGIDNALAATATKHQLLAPLPTAVTPINHSANFDLPATLAAVDHGYVTLNYDTAWFADNNIALPQSLAQLAQPQFAKLLVVEHPATSSPGFAWLCITIAALGEDAAFRWWRSARDNGVAITKGWSAAYYQSFSRNGGDRPLVVSYASSPAAEMYYVDSQPTTAPTANLFLNDIAFHQVEGIGVIAGGDATHAAKFINFIRSVRTQAALQTTMWMLPANADATVLPLLREAGQPQSTNTPTRITIRENSARWISEWIAIMIRGE